ncbi:MAG: hypothetical protein CMN30_03975 [Sandaracinus sp.]|nr:hypothetical protein [Sandaracinus sp.]
MGNNVRIALGGLVTVAAVAGLIALLMVHRSDDRGADEERLTDRMSRTPVRFHQALRAHTVAEGAAFAARLERAATDAREADAIARELLQELGEHEPEPSDAPILEHFGGGELDPASDRLHVLLAMVWSERNPQQSERMPLYAVLNEARALEPSALDPSLRGLAHAAQIFAHSTGGYCELVEPMVPEVERDIPPTLMGEWVEAEEDRAAAAATLAQLQGFLVDGSLACCAIRDERFEETKARLQASIGDAERLGVCEQRMPLLRAWAALLADDRDAAREHLALSDPTELHEDDVEAHRVVSSALAIEGEDATHRALMGSTRVNWLSRVVVGGAYDAMAESALARRLRDAAAADAARRFVAGEIAVIAAARRIDPFFERERSARLLGPPPSLPAVGLPPGARPSSH